MFKWLKIFVTPTFHVYGYPLQGGPEQLMLKIKNREFKTVADVKYRMELVDQFQISRVVKV